MNFDDIGALDFELDDFDISESEPKTSKFGPRYCKPKLMPQPPQRTVKYEKAVAMSRDLSQSIMGGETIHALLSGNFIFGDFVEAFIVENDLLVDDLTISTLGISKENVDSLANLINGDYVQKLDLIVSCYFYSHNQGNIKYIYDQLDVDNKFRFAASGVHTKIVLIRFGDKKIVIHGSANLRSSRSIEMVTIESNDALYDFHKNWHNEITDRCGTIKTQLRASKLWDVIGNGGI